MGPLVHVCLCVQAGDRKRERKKMRKTDRHKRRKLEGGRYREEIKKDRDRV